MQNPDDDRFETYLKEFRPLPLPPLTLGTQVKSKRRSAAAMAWALSAAAVVLIGVLLLWLSPRHSGITKTKLPQAAADVREGPLTLGAANQLLVKSPSFAAAFESLDSESFSIPKGKESALAVLRQENPNP